MRIPPAFPYICRTFQGPSFYGSQLQNMRSKFAARKIFPDFALEGEFNITYKITIVRQHFDLEYNK